MHEMGITQSIVAIVAEQADGRKVKRVTLEIGKLAAVMPDAIRFCFDVVAQGSALDGAALDIIEIPGRARCLDCGSDVMLTEVFRAVRLRLAQARKARRPRTQHQEHGIGGGLMCKTCGCDDDAKVTAPNLQTGNEERMEKSAPVTPPHHAHDHHHDHHHHDNHHHGHEPHDHDHTHHDHDHSHALQPAALAAVAGLHTVTVDIERAILDKNDRLAERNRAWFEGREILALNLVSSPGAGKTTLLERTIRDLKNEMPISVIEGDQQTLNDAERIKAAGAPAVQVNTGTGCHLEADMIRRGLDSLRPAFGSVLMIENVGNLVCPALFDLGERAKVVVLSVTEGDDKPLKYPHMFKAAELMVISKIDLAPHVDFDISRCEAMAREVNPQFDRSGCRREPAKDWAIGTNG